MPHAYSFDANNTLTIRQDTAQTFNGSPVTNSTQSDISARQLKRHRPMLIAYGDMPPATLAQVDAIIAAQG